MADKPAMTKDDERLLKVFVMDVFQREAFDHALTDAKRVPGLVARVEELETQYEELLSEMFQRMRKGEERLQLPAGNYMTDGERLWREAPDGE